MKNFLSPREYFRLVYKVFFKIISLERETGDWSKKKMVSTLLQLGVYNYIVGLLLTLTIHLLWMYVAGKKFNIYTNDIFSDVAIGVGICTVINVFDNRKDYNGADIAFSLLTSLPCGFILSTYYFMELLGVSPMLALGIFALSFTTALGIFFAAVSLYNPVIIISGRIMVICGIAGISIFNELNIVYVLFISTVCLFIINRSFHYPFLRFRAVYHQLYPLSWDENIALPIWFLPKKIRKDAKKNRSATIAFSMMLLRERPLHRKSAQKGLFYIACDTLIAFKSLEDLSKTRKSLSFMPEEFPEEYSQPFSHLIEESRNIQQALNNYNPSNRIREIRKAQVRLQEFEKEMNYTRDKEAREFEKLAQAWLVLIHKYLQENEHNLPLPNPFVTGPALKAKEETFVGREDILNEIKTEALKEGAAGAILFLGNRRTGKTSTLYNLPQVLPSDIQAHYFDAQDIRMKSEQGFYRQLLKSFGSIEINNEADFTALTDFFEAQDAKLKEENKLALVCLDEYERFADLAHFPDTLRYWIQHLNNIVFLLAGSYELDENKADEPNASIQKIDWTDYLINARTVKISYLSREAALKLVTKPIPEFDLVYESDDLPDKLVIQTGGQPYLLQYAMYELTEFLNTEERKTASSDDLETAIKKMLEGAAQYFMHIWEKTLDETSQSIILHLAETGKLPATERKYIKRLLHKEFIRETTEGEYEFCVPVFRTWVLDNFSNIR